MLSLETNFLFPISDHYFIIFENMVYQKRSYSNIKTKDESGNVKWKKTKRTQKMCPTQIEQSVKTYVKKAISRAAEKKVFIQFGANQSIQAAAGTNPIAQYILPQIGQGSSNSTRVGNRIKITSGYVRGFCNLLPFNAVSNPNPLPLKVKVWLCSNRKINSNNIASTNIANDFFEINGATTGFQGNMLDMVLSENKDVWQIWDSITLSLGTSNVTSTGPVSTGSYADGSPMSSAFYFNLSKICTALKYDDSTSVPTNRNLFLVFTTVNSDGSADAALIPAEYHYQVRYEYTDL